jgi:putative transposase
MSSTHLALHYHLVFSTKGRRRMIADAWRCDLHAYLGGILREMNVIPEAINGPGGSRSYSRGFESDPYVGGSVATN